MVKSLLKRWYQYSIILCVLLLTACNEEVLYTNLSERDANEMLAVLLGNRIQSERVETAAGIYSIVISEKGDFPYAIALLSNNGYPKKNFESMGQIFTGDGMVTTPLEQKARYTYAVSQELTKTISQISGITSARVHIVLPETDPITRKKIPASSSVMIKHTSNMDIATISPQIKTLIANAVDNLTYENISVVLFEDASFDSRYLSGSKAQNIDRVLRTEKMLAVSSKFEEEKKSTSLGYGLMMLLILIIIIVMVVIAVLINKQPIGKPDKQALVKSDD